PRTTLFPYTTLFRSRHDRSEDDPDHHDERDLRAAERDERRHRDDDQRQRQHGVDDAADRLVHEPEEVAGDEPEGRAAGDPEQGRSEEHTSELQSREN